MKKIILSAPESHIGVKIYKILTIYKQNTLTNPAFLKGGFITLRHAYMRACIKIICLLLKSNNFLTINFDFYKAKISKKL